MQALTNTWSLLIIVDMLGKFLLAIGPTHYSRGLQCTGVGDPVELES